MKKYTIKTRILYSFIILNLLFWNLVGGVQAFGGSSIKVPSIEEVMNKVENQYGFDKDFLRKAQVKSNYPTTEVFFDKTAPKRGEKVVATAMPKYFKNASDDLYYTWFLFRADDDLKDDEAMENAKRRAMGIVARGDFDPALFEIDYSDSNVDPDKDGYDASFGGDDGVGGRRGIPRGEGDYESEHYLTPVAKQIVDTDKISRCYRHNFGVSDPEEYELTHPGGDLIIECEHKFAEANKGETFENPANPNVIIECKSGHEVGDGEFTTNEEACWRLNPNSSDTDGDGFKDEEDLAGLGQTQFTWTFNPGDRVGVVIEGTSLVVINEGEGNASTSITSQSINTSGVLSETADTVTSGGSASLNGGVSVNDDGTEGAYSTGSISTDSTSETNSTGSVSYPVTEEVVGIERETALNPYYKILWAGLDSCDKEEVEGGSKKDLAKKDECDRNSDYGFTYLASKNVFEQGVSLLESKLNFTPLAPQFNVDNNDYSDYITVNANFVQSGIADDFIYYDWDIYYCGNGELDTCTSNLDNRITPLSCGDGDILGKCAERIESNSYAEGIGISSIRFKLDDNFLIKKGASDNFYLKVFLKTRKSKNDSMVGISSVDIPVVVNDNAIRFFKVSQQATGEYGFDPASDEICVSGVYSQICPVYPGQIIAVQSDVEVDLNGITKAEAYSWELNGQKIMAPLSGSNICSFRNGGCDLGETVYLLMSNSGIELQRVSSKVKKKEGGEVTSERLLSVVEPMARIVSNDYNKAWPWVVDDGSSVGSQSDSVFVGKIGEIISFKADFVPSYLNNNLEQNNISLNWFINGQKVDTEFISANSDYGIALNGQNIEFKVTGKEGETINLLVEVIKEFSIEEQIVLSDNWNVKDFKNLESKKIITIKKTNIDSMGVVVKGNSIQRFMASTLTNAPEYFVFIIRTAIVFILFWFFIFGFNYWFSREINLKRND